MPEASGLTINATKSAISLGSRSRWRMDVGRFLRNEFASGLLRREIGIHLPDELRDALGAEAGHHGVDRNLGASRQFGEVSRDPEYVNVLILM